DRGNDDNGIIKNKITNSATNSITNDISLRSHDDIIKSNVNCYSTTNTPPNLLYYRSAKNNLQNDLFSNEIITKNTSIISDDVLDNNIIINSSNFNGNDESKMNRLNDGALYICTNTSRGPMEKSRKDELFEEENNPLLTISSRTDGRGNGRSSGSGSDSNRSSNIGIHNNNANVDVNHIGSDGSGNSKCSNKGDDIPGRGIKKGKDNCNLGKDEDDNSSKEYHLSKNCTMNSLENNSVYTHENTPSPKLRVRGDKKSRCLKNVLGSKNIGNEKKNISNDMNKAKLKKMLEITDKLIKKKYRGISYDPTRNGWSTFVYKNGIRYKKFFSSFKYGNLLAKKKSIEWRLKNLNPDSHAYIFSLKAKEEFNAILNDDYDNLNNNSKIKFERGAVSASSASDTDGNTNRDIFYVNAFLNLFNNGEQENKNKKKIKNKNTLDVYCKMKKQKSSSNNQTDVNVAKKNKNKTNNKSRKALFTNDKNVEDNQINESDGYPVINDVGYLNVDKDLGSVSCTDNYCKDQLNYEKDNITRENISINIPVLKDTNLNISDKQRRKTKNGSRLKCRKKYTKESSNISSSTNNNCNNEFYDVNTVQVEKPLNDDVSPRKDKCVVENVDESGSVNLMSSSYLNEGKKNSQEDEMLMNKTYCSAMLNGEEENSKGASWTESNVSKSEESRSRSTGCDKCSSGVRRNSHSNNQVCKNAYKKKKKNDEENCEKCDKVKVDNTNTNMIPTSSSSSLLCDPRCNINLNELSVNETYSTISEGSNSRKRKRKVTKKEK
ncbi:transcription factor with AP2 domain(s), putative, partial [Plasmodium malariae]